MINYIPANKLKAEIERMHKAHSGKYGCDEVGVTLEYLEDFIDSILQEQPEVDLEKEIEMYVSEKGLRDYAFLVPSIARHFWNKGYNARKEN